MPVVTPATGGVSHNSSYGGVCVVKHGRALVFAIDPSTKELRVMRGEARKAKDKKKAPKKKIEKKKMDNKKGNKGEHQKSNSRKGDVVTVVRHNSDDDSLGLDNDKGFVQAVEECAKRIEREKTFIDQCFGRLCQCG